MRHAFVIAVPAYLVLSVLSADQQFFFESGLAVLLCLSFVNLGIGVFAARWWALGLPFLAVLLAIPFGLPNEAGGEPFPTWFNLLFVSPILVALVALGVAAPKLWGHRRGPARV